MITHVQTMTSSMNYFDSDWNNLEEFAKWKPQAVGGTCQILF